jgi:hypothetical protein
VDPALPWRHHSGKLAEQVLRFWQEQAGEPYTAPAGLG